MNQMTARPMLQDLVKQAMAASAANISASQEAQLQRDKTASAEEEKKCEKCGKEKCACGSKMASVDANTVEKLAGALDFISAQLKTGASITEHVVTNPPGVSQATASTPLPDHKGQGHAIVPMHTPEQKGLPTERGKTMVENNLHDPPGGSEHMMQRNYGGKTASPLEMIRAKTAGAATEKKETEGLREAEKGLAKVEHAHASEPENKDKEASIAALTTGLLARVKQAEDALNPANITAGKAVPPDTSASGQPGGHPAGGAPQGHTGLVGSNQAARDYTRGQAYADRKIDLGKYFKEPALSAATDKTLQVAFEHTGKAGPKIASAPEVVEGSLKTAAARALLGKLAEAAEQEKSKTAAATAR